MSRRSLPALALMLAATFSFSLRAEKLSELSGFLGPRWTEAISLEDMRQEEENWLEARIRLGERSLPGKIFQGMPKDESSWLLAVEIPSEGAVALVPALEGSVLEGIRLAPGHPRHFLLAPRACEVSEDVLARVLGPLPASGPSLPSPRWWLPAGGSLRGVLDRDRTPWLDSCLHRLGVSGAIPLLGRLGSGFPDRLLGVPSPGPLKVDLRGDLALSEAKLEGFRGLEVRLGGGSLYLRDGFDGPRVGVRSRVRVHAGGGGQEFQGEFRFPRPASGGGAGEIHGLATAAVWGQAMGLTWLDLQEPVLRFQLGGDAAQQPPGGWLLSGGVSLGTSRGVAMITSGGKAFSSPGVAIWSPRFGLGDLLRFCGRLGAGERNAQQLAEGAIRTLAPLALREGTLTLLAGEKDPPRFSVRGQLVLATVPRGEFHGVLGARGLRGTGYGETLSVGEVSLAEPRFELEVWGAGSPQLRVAGVSSILGVRARLDGLATREGLELRGVGSLAPGYDADLVLHSGAWNYPAPRVEARLSPSSLARLSSQLEAEVLEARAQLTLEEYRAEKVPVVRMRVRRPEAGTSEIVRRGLGRKSMEALAASWRAQSSRHLKPPLGGTSEADVLISNHILETFRTVSGGFEPEELVVFLRTTCGAGRLADRHPLGRPELPGWRLSKTPGDDEVSSFCDQRAGDLLQALGKIRPAPSP